MDFSAVQAAEQELLTSVACHDQNRLRELLHPDFIEVGRTGLCRTRDEIVIALADEDDRAPTLTDEWKFVELSPNLALVTYVIRNSSGDSRHSSIWISERGQLQMRFHQATFIVV